MVKWQTRLTQNQVLKGVRVRIPPWARKGGSMAHIEQRDFFLSVKDKFPHFFTDVSVIEIGSLDINGSVRDFFSANRYVGVDLAEGPGVDLVGEGQDIDFEDRSFDVAVSAECFEHNPYWLETFNNMYRMADKFVIFTCASDGRPEHGTSRTTPENSPFTIKWDYYRNLNEKDFRMNFDFDSSFNEYNFYYNLISKDLYFWGIKNLL